MLLDLLVFKKVSRLSHIGGDGNKKWVYMYKRIRHACLDQNDFKSQVNLWHSVRRVFMTREIEWYNFSGYINTFRL